MSKNHAINIRNNSNLIDKKGVLYMVFYIKKIYYQKNRDVILNRAKDYHKNHKKILRQ